MGKDDAKGTSPSGDQEGAGAKRFSEMTPRELKSDLRVRLWVGGILAILGLIFVVQNTEQVSVDFFFWSFDIALIWVLIAMVLLGVIITLLVQWRRRVKSKKS
ncbi:MAG: LapA family protein [Candidatus Nanopelagicales bacterium]